MPKRRVQPWRTSDMQAPVSIIVPRRARGARLLKARGHVRSALHDATSRPA